MNDSNETTYGSNLFKSTEITIAFRSISVIGVFFNSITLLIIILNRKILKSALYNHLIANISINMLFCLASFEQIVDRDNCYFCNDSFIDLIYRYVMIILLQHFQISSSISDIILMLSRYFHMTKKKNFIVQMSTLLNVMICLITPTINTKFLIHRFKIEKKILSGYRIRILYYNNKNIFHIFGRLTFFCFGFLPAVVQLIISIITIVKLHKVIARKRRILPNEPNFKGVKIKFTIVVLMQMTVLICVRMFNNYLNLETSVFKQWLNEGFVKDLLISSTRLGLLTCHALPCMFYIMIDTNLQKILRRLFS